MGRPRVGAKAVSWQWQWLVDHYSDKPRCYQLSARMAAMLVVPLEQASWSTRWFDRDGVDFDDIDAYVSQVYYSLLSPVDCVDNTNKANSGAFGLIEIEKEEEDCMPILRVENIDGVPYLEEDCGCGERKYYSLTLATINPSTGAISGELDTPPSYISNVPLTQDQIDSCYSSKVATIVKNALVAYTDAVFDFALLGIGTFFPATTTAIIAAVEIQQGVDAWLNGNLTLDFSNVGYTSDEVIEVFESAEFDAFLQARLGDDQQISRFVLELVGLRLLNNSALNVPTPTYPVFAAWTKMCNIAELNLQLQTAATECSTGNDQPENLPFVAEWGRSFDFSGSENDWNNGGLGGNASWEIGNGWTIGGAPSTFNTISINFNGASQVYDITGVKVFFAPNISGTNPSIEIGNALDFSLGVTAFNSGVASVAVPVVGFDNNPLSLLVRRGDGQSMSGFYIASVNVYGTGLVPTEGVPVA